MSFVRLSLIFVFSIVGFAAAGETEPQTESEACESLNMGASIPGALRELFGPYETCKRTEYQVQDFGVSQTMAASWTDFRLTISAQPPQAKIYVVEATGPAGLSPEWFLSNRDRMIDPGFGIDWSFDAFPGPTAEHFQSREPGTNAQVWIERNAKGEITWFRFSYAL